MHIAQRWARSANNRPETVVKPPPHVICDNLPSSYMFAAGVFFTLLVLVAIVALACYVRWRYLEQQQ